ncbi:MAG: TRAP transporter large permease subunit [Bacillota bacterium]
MFFILAVVTKRLKWPNFVEALSSSASIAAIIFMIILGGKLFGTFLTRSRIPYELSDYIVNLDVSPFMIIMIILLIYTVMGFLMDEQVILVIMTLIMYPIVFDPGYDPIWFGVLPTLMLFPGLMTPPVRVVSPVVSSVTKIHSEQVFRYQVTFWITLVIGAVLVSAFPQIVLFLPNLMY